MALHGAVFTRPVRAHLGASHFGQYSVVPRLTNGPSLDLRRVGRRPGGGPDGKLGLEITPVSRASARR